MLGHSSSITLHVECRDFDSKILGQFGTVSVLDSPAQNLPRATTVGSCRYVQFTQDAVVIRQTPGQHLKVSQEIPSTTGNHAASPVCVRPCGLHV